MKKIHPLSLAILLCLLAFVNQATSQIPDLVITEIMYNPPEMGADSLEFIEIFNNGNTTINLEGIYFSEGITHVFPNQILDAQSYLVIAKNAIAFENVFGIVAIEWTSGILGNTGETIELRNVNDELIDVVEYQNVAPWATAADGLGASLVLCDISSDNSVASNWQAAFTSTGLVINAQEIIANPNAASNCPSGPIVKFVESSINLIEDDITIDLQIVIENGNVNSTEVAFDLNASSTGILDEDFLLDEMLPTTIVFPAGLEIDTQIISVHVLEDINIEQNEILIFEILNPTNGATINPMHDSFEIFLEDDDAILPDLVISEIMYNPPEEGVDSTEFIELFNNDTVIVNMEGYAFTAGVEFVFPEVFLHPNEYLVIARDSNAFADYYGFVPLEWTSGTLVNSGELIEFRNVGGNVAASVEYDNTADWSLAADGGGASLVLCNPDLDNNNSANWEASISNTGIIIDGIEIFADPNMENNCLIPLSAYPFRTIGDMTTVDVEGAPDSLGQLCELKGVVHGVNLNISNGGTQFVLIDENGDGITVYHEDNDFGYLVAEGDEVIVQGEIDQFNGLLEILPDTLWMISSNNTLAISQEVTLLNESTESQLIEIKNLTIIDPSDWDNSNTSGFNVAVTNGTDTFDMRIDQDVDLYQMVVPNFSFNLTGLGGQFDFDSPYLEDYQILPRFFEDLEIVTSNENIVLEESIEIYPNPMHEIFNVKMPSHADKIQVHNILGQAIFTKPNPSLIEQIPSSTWDSGTYLVRVFYSKKVKVFMVNKY